MASVFTENFNRAYDENYRRSQRFFTTILNPVSFEEYVKDEIKKFPSFWNPYKNVRDGLKTAFLAGALPVGGVAIGILGTVCHALSIVKVLTAGVVGTFINMVKQPQHTMAHLWHWANSLMNAAYNIVFYLQAIVYSALSLPFTASYAACRGAVSLFKGLDDASRARQEQQPTLQTDNESDDDSMLEFQDVIDYGDKRMKM